MTEITRNAIIMAAGTSSRFVPLSAEVPKGLLEVKGEILVERQIRQLLDADIKDITLVVGYKAEMFEYLKAKFGVKIVHNEDYYKYNNTSSLIRVLDKLDNTYICSSDNYFQTNVFKGNPKQSYYSALYSAEDTGEYCLTIDKEDNITSVRVGGRESWYMIGHVYFSKDFSDRFKEIMRQEYQNPETKQMYWEDVYIKFIRELPKMKIHRYNEGEVNEFDSIDELRQFDKSYISDTRSSILKHIALELECSESSLSGFAKVTNTGNNLSFSFLKDNVKFLYDGNSIKICIL